MEITLSIPSSGRIHEIKIKTWPATAEMQAAVGAKEEGRLSLSDDAREEICAILKNYDVAFYISNMGSVGEES